MHLHLLRPVLYRVVRATVAHHVYVYQYIYIRVCVYKCVHIYTDGQQQCMASFEWACGVWVCVACRSLEVYITFAEHQIWRVLNGHVACGCVLRVGVLCVQVK